MFKRPMGLLTVKAGMLKRKGILMKKLASVFVLTMGLAAGSAMAALPDTGVGVDSLITEGITAMGAVVAVAVGGFIAFKIVKKALGWVGRAF